MKLLFSKTVYTTHSVISITNSEIDNLVTYKSEEYDDRLLELDIDVSASTDVKFSIFLEIHDIPHLKLLGQCLMIIGRKGLDFIGQPGSIEHIDCLPGDVNVWVYVDSLEPYEAREVALSLFYNQDS